jgi:hypothetical protein
MHAAGSTPMPELRSGLRVPQMRGSSDSTPKLNPFLHGQFPGTGVRITRIRAITDLIMQKVRVFSGSVELS